jgi:hypothetical protein
MVAESEQTSFYEEVPNLQKLCNFLRSNEGPAVREAIEMDKRVYYLKGPLKLVTVQSLMTLLFPVTYTRIRTHTHSIHTLTSSSFILSLLLLFEFMIIKQERNSLTS